MTETKRFLIGDAGELIDLNNHKFIDYGDECCNLLNELHEENQELKKKNKKLSIALNELHEENQLLHKINEDAIDFMYDNFDLNIMFTDRELNDICNDMGWELSEKGIKIKQLEKENEELKHFREGVFSLIEDELEEHPYLTLTEKWNPNCKYYHSCRGNHEKNVFYASRHTLLKKLREELSYD